MTDDLTRYVAPQIEARLRAKAEALGLEFNRYLRGIIEGEPWGWGENDPDSAIGKFIADHADAVGDWRPYEKARPLLKDLGRRRA